MSESELFALIVHGVIALVVWTRWYKPLFSLRSMGRAAPGVGFGAMMPVACLGLTLLGLQTLAASDVVSTFYVVWYAVMAAAWVGVAATMLMPFFGLRWLDDALERRNPAAMVAVLGGLLGLTLSFLGGNFGDGPGWWVVAYCGVLAFGCFFALWVFVLTLCPLLDRITVERDMAAAIRAAGLMIGGGAIIGRSLAGDWVSLAATCGDFIQVAWAAPLLAMIEVSILRLTPIVRGLSPGLMLAGVIPAGLYVCLTAGYLVEIGWW